MAYFHIHSESREYWKVLCGVHLRLNIHFIIQPHGFLFSVRGRGVPFFYDLYYTDLDHQQLQEYIKTDRRKINEQK